MVKIFGVLLPFWFLYHIACVEIPGVVEGQTVLNLGDSVKLTLKPMVGGFLPRTGVMIGDCHQIFLFLLDFTSQTFNALLIFLSLLL